MSAPSAIAAVAENPGAGVGAFLAWVDWIQRHEPAPLRPQWPDERPQGALVDRHPEPLDENQDEEDNDESEHKRRARRDIREWLRQRAWLEQQRKSAFSAASILRARLRGERLVPFLITRAVLLRLVPELASTTRETQRGIATFLGWVLEAYDDGGRCYAQANRNCERVCGIPDRTLRRLQDKLCEAGVLLRFATARDRPEHEGKHSQLPNLYHPGLLLLLHAAECRDANVDRDRVTFARLDPEAAALEALASAPRGGTVPLPALTDAASSTSSVVPSVGGDHDPPRLAIPGEAPAAPKVSPAATTTIRRPAGASLPIALAETSGPLIPPLDETPAFEGQGGRRVAAKPSAVPAHSNVHTTDDDVDVDAMVARGELDDEHAAVLRRVLRRQRARKGGADDG